jgi:hypothetical protein
VNQYDETLLETSIKQTNTNGDIEAGKTAHVTVLRSGDVGIRLVLDPYGDDHDLLFLQEEGKWVVFVHPHGGDPVCFLEITPNRTTVHNDSEETLATFDHPQ